MPEDKTLFICVDWKEFLKESSIEEQGTDEWLVSFRESNFKVKYENFVMYPRSLSGICAFIVRKLKPNYQSDWDYEWDIHVRADLRTYPKEEILRVVWSHLGRTKGDYTYTLYEYDRLDKERPKDAIGEPKDMGNGIKRWKIRLDPVMRSSIAETYIYLAPDGKQSDIILVDTIKGYEWETPDIKRFNSFRAAEKHVLKKLTKIKT